MLYAVVDIETTGGYAASHGITEIAIFVTDGKEVIDQYQSLINPDTTIPPFIESLTGITNEMVSSQPGFASLAPDIYAFLRDKIFVAHNVNFDYSFVKYHLLQSGFELDSKKLCTIRLSRQVLPGLRSYGLDKICHHTGIAITDRHRASGDAAATVQLLHHLIQRDGNGCLEKMLKSGSKEHFLPPNLPADQIRSLPQSPGVYYFHDKKGKVLYVGKAKNLSKRVNSHFSNNKTNGQKQEFLKKIYSVSFERTATELTAEILESIEIRKIWPEQNRSQKRFEPNFGLYSFEDNNGYLRLFIDKKKKQLKAHYTFGYLHEGNNLLWKLVRQFRLCPGLCFLISGSTACDSVSNHSCQGACKKSETAEEYNARVNQSLQYLEDELPSFALVDRGTNDFDKSCILIEKGIFFGMGTLPADTHVSRLDELKNFLTPYPDNGYIRGLVFKHAQLFPQKKVTLQPPVSA